MKKENKANDLVIMIIKKVPREVRLNFKLACMARGKTMSEELIWLMEEYVKMNDFSMK
jgi:hypothetical protein